MLLPADWDLPDKDNDRLCAHFEKNNFMYNGYRMPYRLFRPKRKESGLLPLVLYLHGADAVGEDNEAPLGMHDIGTMFAKKAWQAAHPCCILAPQYGHGQHWSMENTQQTLWELINELLTDLPVDPSRIYVYGYSAGGVGTLRMLKEHPSFFAAAIAICGATGRDGLASLRKTPLWLVHAVDDEIVKASYRSPGIRELSHLGSRDIFDFFRQKSPEEHPAYTDGIFNGCKALGGRELRYTEYAPGKIKALYNVNPHCAWVAVSDNANNRFREWLFQNIRNR